jgi:hypothetical protein
MAWPAASQTATWDKTSGTFDPSVDPHLWEALQARSPLLDRTKRFSVDDTLFSWETANAPTRLFVLANGTTSIEDGAGTEVAATFTSGTDIEEGTILKNVSRATPIGTYGADELIEVTANTAGACTVVRDVGRQNSGTGSTAHTIGDSFAVIFAPKEEGSSADRNKYRDVTLVTGYTNILDFYLAITGSQAASKRLIPADNLQAQFENCMRQLQNELEGMLLYGCLNNGANAGSDSYVRRTKGLDSYLCASGANIDYSTKAVTEEAINAQVAAILEDASDPADDYIIVCHPANARVVSTFGSDKVVTSPEKSKWGRYIDTFRSDLGVDMDVLWTLNCSKSDLFIIDMNKISLAQFRPFSKGTVTFQDDTVDAYRQRYLGEVGVRVVDALYSHAKLGYLTW